MKRTFNLSGQRTETEVALYLAAREALEILDMASLACRAEMKASDVIGQLRSAINGHKDRYGV